MVIIMKSRIIPESDKIGNIAKVKSTRRNNSNATIVNTGDLTSGVIMNRKMQREIKQGRVKIADTTNEYVIVTKKGE